MKQLSILEEDGKVKRPARMTPQMSILDIDGRGRRTVVLFCRFCRRPKKIQTTRWQDDVCRLNSNCVVEHQSGVASCRCCWSWRTGEEFSSAFAVGLLFLSSACDRRAWDWRLWHENTSEIVQWWGRSIAHVRAPHPRQYAAILVGNASRNLGSRALGMRGSSDGERTIGLRWHGGRWFS